MSCLCIKKPIQSAITCICVSCRKKKVCQYDDYYQGYMCFSCITKDIIPEPPAQNRILKCCRCRIQIDYYWGNIAMCVTCSIKDKISQTMSDLDSLLGTGPDDNQHDEKTSEKIPEPPNPNWDLTQSSQ